MADSPSGDSFQARAQAFSVNGVLPDELSSLLCEIERIQEDLEEVRGRLQHPCVGVAPDCSQDDVAHAARLNQEGHAKYRLKDWKGALSAYAQAAKLHPSEAAYHSNMAAALLRIKQYAAAKQAALISIQLDGSSARAQARCAAALEGLHDWDRAAETWRQLLRTHPGHTGAISGVARCEASNAQQAAVNARLPPRQSLPRTSPDGQAADQLAHAQEMAASGLSLAAKFALVESLILCDRLSEASEALQQLPAGPDTAYLAAEVSLRGGAAADARRHLLPWITSTGADAQQQAKCAELLGLASQLEASVSTAEQLLQGGNYPDCMAACSTARDWAAQHLPHAHVLQRIELLKGEAMLGVPGQASAAAQMLSKSARGVGDWPKAFWLHAQALLQCGQPHQAFCRLLELQSYSPTYPGVSDAVQEAAKAALANQQSCDELPSTAGNTLSPRLKECCELLELPLDCWCQGKVTRTQLDSAYRRQAAQSHPDRAVASSKRQSAGALHPCNSSSEATFIRVRQAYDYMLQQL